MAVSAGDMRQEGSEVKFREKVYEKVWTIPDWMRVQQNEESLTAQIFHFESRNSRRVRTKWEIGFNATQSSKTFNIYWKLIEVKGFPVGTIQATISTAVLRDNSTTSGWVDTQVKTFDLGERLRTPHSFSFDKNETYWRFLFNSNGEFKIKLNLTILEPETYAVETRMKEFHKTSVGKFCANFAALLNDKSTADLKIQTSDQKEMWAHKIILKAQCPVFDSMFRSKMFEDQTGVVDVKDVTGKTMSILLHYFYSGELLPSWKDEDTVVEFTYAVGKYQLNGILELLDDVLGNRDEEGATQTDVLLLDLAAKLGLKNAEKELLERVVDKTNKVKSRDELFELYGNWNK